MRTTRRLVLAASTLAVGGLALLPNAASAHADADVIAVAAGEAVTINFRPNHGCGDSPTTEVAVRVPVSGATGGAVEGWTATAEDDGEGRTVVEWTGGSLPTDVTGAFPVTFTAPDTVGELLLFPSVQGCENGEELSWLNGDPESDNPAPRLLILAPGSEEAVTLDEVPQDAAGRDQLTAVIDTATTTTTTTTTAPATTTTVDEEEASETTIAAAATEKSANADADESSSGAGTVAIILIAGTAIVVLAGVLYLWRRESKTTPEEEG